MSDSPKIAIVIDALPAFAGAEHVLAAALEIYPSAPIYTLVYRPSAFGATPISNHRVYTSWIQRVPGGLTHYRKYLPLLPYTIEQFDLSAYDLILSFSYAVAHGVLCRPDQLHLSYTFAPLRYAWQSSHEYFRDGPLSPFARLAMHAFRLWDHQASARVDHFVAISDWTASCIQRAYGREAEVIYPPVDVDRFQPLEPRGDYFVAFSRLVKHKRVDLIVDAFSELGVPLIVIGEGPERRRLQARAASNIAFVGRRDDAAVAEILGRARALIHAAEEDFGLVMAEAQAAGCPVIAFAGGAAREIVAAGQTGLLFSDPTVQAVAGAVRSFIRDEGAFNRGDILENASRFCKERFLKQFADMVDREWADFVGSQGVQRVRRGELWIGTDQERLGQSNRY